MRIQDVMSTNVRTIGPESSADDAVALMEMNDIHHLIVMDGPDVVGVISSRDLPEGNSKTQRGGLRVADVMHNKPITAAPTDTVRQAANKLRGHGIGCLPVMEGGKVKGILTITDCLNLIGRGAVRPVA